jgi:hypothetical protein
MTDARGMAEQTSVARWLTIGLVAIAVAGAVWLAVGSSRDGREGPDATAGAPTSGPQATETETALAPTQEAPAPAPADYHVEEGGRLSLDAASLPEGGAVTFALALDPKALGGGEAPLSTVIVSADDGRRLELRATPVAGPQGGARLTLDPAWLEPGLYMIQVRTAEKTPLPLRRYVLEVEGPLR